MCNNACLGNCVFEVVVLDFSLDCGKQVVNWVLRLLVVIMPVFLWPFSLPKIKRLLVGQCLVQFLVLLVFVRKGVVERRVCRQWLCCCRGGGLGYGFGCLLCCCCCCWALWFCWLVVCSVFFAT